MLSPDLLLLMRLLGAVLATYRLSQLVAYDNGPFHVFDWIRRTTGRWAATMPRRWYREHLAEFVTCPFCLGVWFALLLILPVVLPTPVGDFFLLWFGVAGAQAYLEGRCEARTE